MTHAALSPWLENIVTAIVGAGTPFIEWTADHGPERRMGVLGIGLILIGFTLQSVQYWVALLDVNMLLNEDGPNKPGKEIQMRYRLLGNSGLRVSEAALGTMNFGDDWGWGAAKDESRKVYDAFREAGGNFIDTANVYTNGTSESFLGEFMKGHRQSVMATARPSRAG